MTPDLQAAVERVEAKRVGLLQLANWHADDAANPDLSIDERDTARIAMREETQDAADLRLLLDAARRAPVVSREDGARTIYEAEMRHMLSIPREGIHPLPWTELKQVSGAADRYFAAWDAVCGLRAPVAGEAADPSRLPPPHWTPGDRYDRHPKRVEDWDWQNDGPLPERFDLVLRRLNFAGDRADPRAPDQMALVLRRDLIDLKHDWITKDARCRSYREENARLGGRESEGWRPISELPATGWVMLWPVHDDEAPEVWAAEQYHEALRRGPAPGWTHLAEAARRVTHWAPAEPPAIASPADSAEGEGR